jgi:hypothetical protein
MPLYETHFGISQSKCVMREERKMEIREGIYTQSQPQEVLRIKTCEDIKPTLSTVVG